MHHSNTFDHPESSASVINYLCIRRKGHGIETLIVRNPVGHRLHSTKTEIFGCD